MPRQGEDCASAWWQDRTPINNKKQESWSKLDFLFEKLVRSHLGGHAQHTYPPISRHPSQPVSADEETIWWGTFLNFFAFFVCTRWYQVYIHFVRPGWYPRAWSSWHFACRQFAPKFVDLSVRFIRMLFYSSLWASFRRPWSEAPCMYEVWWTCDEVCWKWGERNRSMRHLQPHSLLYLGIEWL